MAILVVGGAVPIFSQPLLGIPASSFYLAETNMPACSMRSFFFLLLVFSFLPAAMDKPQSPVSVWLTDYEQALKIARNDNKPILIVFRCEH